MIEIHEAAPDALVDGPLREAITLAAAAGYVAGGLARLGAGGVDGYGLALRAAAIPLGAVAAAVAAGVVVNLVAIPALARLSPRGTLPPAVYGAAAALCWLAACADAFSRLGPPSG